MALAALVCAPCHAQTAITTAPVEVVGTTPLAGIGVPAGQLPAPVLSIDGRRLEESASVHVGEQLVRQVPAVTVNETQGNPWQPDVQYRGFSASPLLGTPQGLSVYVDGVRVNEPFGDTVNWDLLPRSAIAGLDLIPGSNPAFGLNTLGGALAVRTKSGFTHAGGKAELSAGAFGRRTAGLEAGGHDGAFAWYAAGELAEEDGWRDRSPSDVQQLFGKLSWRHAAAEADLTLLGATSRLVGNGLVPESLLAARRAAIFTHPDETRNELAQIALNGRWWLSDSQSLSGSLYHRGTRTRTLNGDANDDYEDDWADDPATPTGAHNRTRTRQRGNGLAAQWNLTTRAHQLAVGASYDRARVAFRQTRELGDLDDSRGVADLEAAELENQLAGTTRTASVFVADTWSPTPALHLTAAARYNASRVTTRDELNATPPNLDGDHAYRKLNPALGLAWDVAPTLDAYAGVSQGSRIPTPIELGCADPAHPCTLPNAMASDPPLQQVVARTVELGLRGRRGDALRWQAGLFRTLNEDDILFVGTSTSAGYFTNFGRTRRQGLELAVDGRQGPDGRLAWSAAYQRLDATFRSAACLLAANNSSRGTAPECTAGGQDDEILVQPGDRIPGLPRHALKLGASWRITGWLRLGGDLQAFSSQTVRGNENDRHQAGTATDAFGTTRTFDGPGRIGGYALVNLNAEARLGDGWQLVAKVSNLFDRRAATAGALAENPFVGGGFQADPGLWRRETFVAPTAPRAVWVGIRHLFGGSS